MASILHRTVFETSRSQEYFNARELQAQTGQPIYKFAAVVLKELVDNALDACEQSGVSPAIEIDTRVVDGRLRIIVADNGKGIEAETITRLLNFNTRTSDKSAYRSPTRGAQGNALKTIIGMPYALGSDDLTIRIEAHRVCHIIQAWIDSVSELQISHTTEASILNRGTRITITLPAASQALNSTYWALAFALFNPHVSVKIRHFEESSKQANETSDGDNETEGFYQSTVEFPAKWRKYIPSDPTSPHWYDVEALQRLVSAHISAAQRDSKDLLLRDFVRQFRGLSGTAKAKAVCDKLPHIKNLSDFKENQQCISSLLATMQIQSAAPPPSVLGLIGKEHIRQRLDEEFGVRRFWYHKAQGHINGAPFVIEAAIAETHERGDIFNGINFSPTFSDPIADAHLHTPKFNATGLHNFLRQSHAFGDADDDMADDDMADSLNTATVFHLICPSLQFLDRGKTRLNVPDELASEISNVLWRVVRDLYREGEQRKKDAAKSQRRILELRRQLKKHNYSQIEAVFAVLPEALKRATGDGQFPVSARTLFYQVRPLLQEYTNAELEYGYFSQDLLTQYRAEYGDIEGLYYDPRGILYEPHSKQEVKLGTREVDSYDFPHWVYDKILYVEKKGLWPILQAAKIAERYDMAIIAGEGYSTEAARALFQNADKGRSYRLFVLHDADPYGYNIGRTLSEETSRMPGYNVKVVNLGLGFDEALGLGLAAENFTRKKALPEALVLSETERIAFEGQRATEKSWICQRVELNAFNAPDLVAFIERKLVKYRATDKVIPPPREIPKLTEDMYRDGVAELVQRKLVEMLSIDDLVQQIAESLRPTIALNKASQWIKQAFAENDSLSWRVAVERKIYSLLNQNQDVEARVRSKILETLKG